MADLARAMENNIFPEQLIVAWENCEPQTAKIFRGLAKRPFFLPAFAEMSASNQIILARGKSEKKMHVPQEVKSASMITVITGKMEIQISPDVECEPHNCTGDMFTVGPGETVVVPTRIWSVTYSPMSEGFTLGYATTLFWDD